MVPQLVSDKAMEPIMVSTEAFREGMAHLTGAVNVITTDGPKGFAGITATAVCSVTDQPPTLLVCINRNSFAHPFFTGNGVLGINVLRANQQDVAQTFASRDISMPERLARVPTGVLHTGSPLIDNTLVGFDCRITSQHDAGSHSVLICEVMGVRQGTPGEGLVYFRRNYHGIGHTEPEAVG